MKLDSEDFLPMSLGDLERCHSYIRVGLSQALEKGAEGVGEVAWRNHGYGGLIQKDSKRCPHHLLIIRSFSDYHHHHQIALIEKNSWLTGQKKKPDSEDFGCELL